MEFSKFCEYLQKLEKTRSRIEKTEILAGLYAEAEEIREAVSLSYGFLPVITGIADSTMMKAISRAYGFREDEIREMFIKKGDLGDVAEEACLHRRIRPFARKEFSVKEVYSKLVGLAGIAGKGSVEKKIEEVAGLLSHSDPMPAKYLTRIILSTLRLGVGDGIVRDALARAFGRKPEEVERAYNLTGDYGLVAEYLKQGRLDEVKIEIGRPIRVMLAEASSDLNEILSKIREPSAELKYDGFRCQIHKKGNRVWIFSRHMEDLTEKFPDIVEAARQLDGDFIIDGEAVAWKGKFLPFQVLSRRIQRKYGIEEMMKEIPVKVFIFDVIYRNGDLTGLPLKERRKILEEIVPEEGPIKRAEHVESGFREFYSRAVAMGMEGIMIKDLSSHYQPGKRVGTWYKLKPAKETLDVVIVGAEYGEGRKGGLLTSFYIAVNSDMGLVEIGKVSSGFTDEELLEINKRLEGLITERGEIVRIRPEIVIEVGYQEIQRSPNYPSGFALRFPRFLRFRDDKSVAEADTLERVNRLFLKQGRQ